MPAGEGIAFPPGRRRTSGGVGRQPSHRIRIMEIVHPDLTVRHELAVGLLSDRGLPQLLEASPMDRLTHNYQSTAADGP